MEWCEVLNNGNNSLVRVNIGWKSMKWLFRQVSFTNSESSGCGGKINLTKSETFKTQKAALYDPYEDCQWRIYAGTGTNIKLTITRMDLKNANGSHTNVGGNCTGDYLEVRDAAGPLGDLIGRYCGNVIPPPIISSSNSMWIRLFTDDISEGEGVIGTLEPVHCKEPLKFLTPW